MFWTDLICAPICVAGGAAYLQMSLRAPLRAAVSVVRQGFVWRLHILLDQVFLACLIWESCFCCFLLFSLLLLFVAFGASSFGFCCFLLLLFFVLLLLCRTLFAFAAFVFAFLFCCFAFCHGCSCCFCFWLFCIIIMASIIIVIISFFILILNDNNNKRSKKTPKQRHNTKKGTLYFCLGYSVCWGIIWLLLLVVQIDGEMCTQLAGQMPCNLKWPFVQSICRFSSWLRSALCFWTLSMGWCQPPSSFGKKTCVYIYIYLCANEFIVSIGCMGVWVVRPDVLMLGTALTLFEKVGLTCCNRAT